MVKAVVQGYVIAIFQSSVHSFFVRGSILTSLTVTTYPAEVARAALLQMVDHRSAHHCF